MPERFIVTIACGAFETDLEIPAQRSFGEWRQKLLEILKLTDARQFMGWQGLTLSCNGRALLENDSLASVGAFDGSTLNAAREERVN